MALKPNKAKDNDESEEEAKPVTPKAPKALDETSEQEATDDLPDATPKSRAPVSVKAGEAEVTRVDVSEVAPTDEVLVTMFETIDPAPRIGTYNIQQRHGIKALVMRKNYRLPKFVAEVLVDAGKAEYLQTN